MSAELHCHTIYSVDGKWIPEDLVDAAVENGVTTLAVTEHNTLGSLTRVEQRARHHGIRSLPGVEIDATLNGRRVHLVALGVDADNEPLQRLLATNYGYYALKYDIHVKILAERGIQITQQQLQRTLAERYPTHPAPDRSMYSLYKMLDDRVPPIQDPAVVRDIEPMIIREQGAEAFGVYPEVKDVCNIVHEAGGILTLAHVAKYAAGDLATQLSIIETGLGAGLDGFELRHPINVAEPHFARLQAKAEATGCVVTGGSDCHGPSREKGRTIGCMQVDDAIMERIDEALNAVRPSSGAG